MSLSDAVTKAKPIKDNIWLYGQPGIGKTSLLAAMPDVFVIVTSKESGLNKLIDRGRVGEIPHTPPVETWEDFWSVIQELAEGDHPYGMVAIDSITDIAEMAKDYIVRTEYDGCLTKYGSSWGVGTSKYKALLGKAMDLFFVMNHRDKSVGVIMTSGAEAQRRNDPQAGEYNQWGPQIEKNAYELFSKGFDMILFLRHDAQVDRDGRAVAGTTRVLYTEGDNTFIAKNRHGLPRYIPLGLSGDEACANLGKAIVAAKQ